MLGTLGAENFCYDYAGFIKKEKRYGHENLTDDIGGCQEGGHYENKNNDVFSIAAQLLGVHDADFGKEEYKDGQLKDDTQSEQKSARKGEILLDGREHPDIFGVVTQKEPEGYREDNKITEERSAEEKDCTDGDKRDDIPLFFVEESGGYKQPYLM